MKYTWMLVLGLVGATVCSAKELETSSVLLQALDKTTGRTSYLNLTVGEPYTYGDLVVRPQKCMKHPPEETPENAVFLQITENEQEIFKGWMFSSNPALAAMEHPVYDIWIVECKNDELVSETLPTIITDEEELESVDTEDLED